MPEPSRLAIPNGARAAARVILLSDRGRILLLRARDSSLHEWWILPGGGVGANESFESAASREVREETGLSCSIGEWVWTRRHIYAWEGRRHDQYERYFIANERVAESEILPAAPDSYVIGYRWWSIQEIQASGDDFTPRRLGDLLPAIAAGEYPSPALDCGV
jgi:8-oxo-dGTP pyrophosphatase MutT (NUDIX family)